MTTDTQHLFSTNHELLTDISQFHVSLTNQLLSMNEGSEFYRQIFASNNQLMREELEIYKVYDC